MKTNRLSELMKLLTASVKQKEYRMMFALFMKFEECFTETEKEKWINYLDNLKQDCISLGV